MADFIPNLGEALLLGQSFRLRREEENRRQQLFRQQQQQFEQQQHLQNVVLPEARRRAGEGDLSMLAASAPKEAESIIRRRRADEEFELKKQQHDFRVQEAQRLKATGNLANFLKLRGVHTDQQFIERQATDPEFAREYEEERLKVARAGAPRTQLTVGTGDLGAATSSVRSGLQEDLKRSSTTLGNIREIRNILKLGGGSKNMVGLLPGLERKRLNLIDELPFTELTREQRGQVELLNDLHLAVGRINIRETKEFYGSAVAAQEMQRSKENMLNADMGSLQFDAALNAMERQEEIASSVAQELLGEGFTSTGAKGFGARADKLYREKREAAAESRASELVLEGKFNESQILDELMREGLISRSEWTAEKAKLVK